MALGRKLLLGVGIPAGTAAAVGMGYFWQQTARLSAEHPELEGPLLRALEAAGWSLFGLAATLVVSTALSLHLFLTRPVRKLAAAMKRAEDGDVFVRAESTGNDEIARLADSFNQMLIRLTSMKASEIDTHRDLIAAQHELTLERDLNASNVKLANRLTELTLLFDVARSFTSTLELPELFDRISRLVAERLAIPQFSIMLATPDGRLQVKSAYPVGRGTEGLTFEPGEGACGIAASSQKAVYLPDIHAEKSPFLFRSGDGDIGSLLCVPMIYKGTLLGVLNFQRPEKAAFDSEEIELLTAVADQAALAVKNARLHEETVALSITDPLTGAPNRRHLFTQLEMEIARANRFGNQVSIVMIDIDHFKHLNDTAGHRAGDQILRQVYELMQGIIRKVDTLARYGGEEFMLILPQVTKPEAVEVAEKLRRMVEETDFPNGRGQPLGKITISLGVSNLPVDATRLEHLVDCADSALYASKRGGRNTATAYAPGMEQHPGRERGPKAQKKAKAQEA